MEYYQVFLKVILKEIERFKLNTEVYSTYVNRLTASLDVNFDVSYNRCAYMCKYASTCLYFFNDCVNLFLLDCKDAKDMLSGWKYYSEVNVCSLSIGPGLDYLTFVLAILKNDSSPPNFSGAVISKHGAWRNTMNFMLDVFHEQGYIFEVGQSKLNYDMKVIQADLFRCFSEKQTIVSLSDAHVVLMMKTLNLLAAGTPQEGPILNMLKGLISSLKTDAVIFCIDTKPSLALLSQALSNFPGKFLYGPIHQSIKLPGDFAEVEGCRPVMSTRGAFFVWQKLPSFSSMMDLSTSLDMIPVCIENKSELTVSSERGQSYLSTSIKDEANEDTDSDNAPWMELKTFWQSSSPATKDILKKLMLSDVKSLEQIGDTNFQVEKLDIKTNEPLNMSHTEILEGTEVLSPVCISTLTTANCINDSSDVQNSSVDCSSFDTVDNPSPTETLNANNANYKNISSYSGIVEIDPLSDVKKLNNYDFPVRIKVNSGEANILRDDAGLSPDQDEVKTANAPDSKSTSLNSATILADQINNFVNVSFDVSAKNNLMKIDSEEYTVGEGDAVVSSHEKIIQTDSEKCTNSTSIKQLTDRIKHLVSSLESISQQNGPGDYEICNRLSNNTQNQHRFASNDNNVPSCSKHSPNYEPTEINNLSSCKCADEKKAFQCIGYNSRCHCCLNTCNLMQVHNCSGKCHFCVPMCSCNMSCEEHHENNISPNIVIPVRNISEEALLKIMLLLNLGTKSN